MSTLRFDHPYLLIMLLLLWLVIVWKRVKHSRVTYYRYPLAVSVANSMHQVPTWQNKALFVARAATLLGLCFYIARPRWVDTSTQLYVNGIDIVLALDVSGSMEIPDASRSGKSRLAVAKEEAIRFIEKRINDPIGVIIFGKDVMTRCPLTLDKGILRGVIEQLCIGFIDPRGTVLFSGLATALSRLQGSSAKSKVVILLTDGYPTGDELSEHIVQELAATIGAKIYTIGIGGAITLRGFGGSEQDAVDMALLERIASSSGGRAFRVHDNYQLRAVYDKIDQLEKTDRESDIFTAYTEALSPVVWLIVLLLFLEALARLWWWRRVWW